MKTMKQEKPLLPRTLFGVKRTTLEAKIASYFEFSQDVATFIKYLVVVMVRNSLVVSDFSFLCQELVCEVFLTAEPSDALREYCAYFKDYFKNSGDWDKVVRRLFVDKKEYYRLTEKARAYKKRLDNPGTEKPQNPELALRLVSTFEDASGKKHALTIADADETRSRAETSQILEILTTVAFFETAAGVRRFVKLVQAKRPGVKDTFVEEEVSVEEQVEEQVEDQVEHQDALQVASVQNSEAPEVKTIEIVVPAGVDLSTLDDQELLTLVRVGHPDVVSLENVRVVFTEEEPEEPVADELEMQEPTLDLEPMSAQTSQTLLKDRATPKTATDVSDPPTAKPQKPNKTKLLTPKGAYVRNLIENGPQKKGSWKKKGDSAKKKRK
ncbi:hypothetical protein KQI58_10905 [Enterococcus raffinosus]|uniref:hypothetical protein n=1 Tax=Enterococcus raffinosus TaxID=71452 RepID=UPI001C12103A|nr:hypothetical protein [Enterococcus raffinosus]MBU5361587.1 hypothetical protein [Enterococcus raffinosus]